MKNWKWVIKTQKQKNGLWGMPFNCVFIKDLCYNLSEENWLKQSALFIGIAERYPEETFKIYFASKDGFFVQLSKTGWKKIEYKNYSLQGNTLTWIGGSINEDRAN